MRKEEGRGEEKMREERGAQGTRDETKRRPKNDDEWDKERNRRERGRTEDVWTISNGWGELERHQRGGDDGREVGRTVRGDCGGEVRRPGREGEDEKRDERGRERVAGGCGNGWGGCKRGAEPGEAGRC